MGTELHGASVSLEHAIRSIKDSERGHREFVDADLIDEDIGLRHALAIAITELLDRIKELENEVEWLKNNYEGHLHNSDGTIQH